MPAYIPGFLPGVVVFVGLTSALPSGPGLPQLVLSASLSIIASTSVTRALKRGTDGPNRN